VICDCPVYLEFQDKLFKDAISPIKNKIIIGINCSLEELERREQQRGDRRLGLAKTQYKAIHNYLSYDISFNSDEFTANEIASGIVSYLTNKSIHL